MNNHEELFRALAAVNPVPNPRTVTLATPERDALLRHIYEDQDHSHRARSRRLLLVGIAIAIAATLIPAVAISGRLSPLFDFSNRGTPDERQAQQLSSMRVAERLGFQPGSTLRMAERSGIVFFTARDKEQRQCFGVSSASDDSTPMALMCPGPDESAPFPSPSRPVLDLSPMVGRDGSTHMYFPSMMGFAADGVAEVGVVDLDGAIHTTSVQGNVYLTNDVADVPAQAVVALNAKGEVVWRRAVPTRSSG